jgi:hypothetical protein
MATIVAACGLDCGSCPAYIATQANDEAEIAEISALWSQEYGGDIKPENVWCDGCVTEGVRRCGHVAECKIRTCVVERGLENCAACADYACDVLAGLFDHAPGARETLDALRDD